MPTDGSVTTAQRKKREVEDYDKFRTGGTAKQMVTTYLEEEDFDDDDADANALFTKFKNGELTLKGKQYVTVQFTNADSNAAAGESTVNESTAFSLVLNENANEGESDASYAPYATAMGAITLALGALAF